MYKLEEIDRRLGLLRQGQRVLDLGASPGSWSMYASTRVGGGGLVRAIDLKEAGQELPRNVDYRVQDAFELAPESLCEGGLFDVVLSDMAPSTTGHRKTDQYRSAELFDRARSLAVAVLKPGGCFVGKIFQGSEFEEVRDAMRPHFVKIRVIRPKATRDESYELFLIGLDSRAAGGPSSEPGSDPPAT